MNNFKKGFTLIELLVVIAIIGILAAVVFISVSYTRVSARKSAWKTTAKNIQTTVAVYCGSNPTFTGSGTANEASGDDIHTVVEGYVDGETATIDSTLSTINCANETFNLVFNTLASQSGIAGTTTIDKNNITYPAGF